MSKKIYIFDPTSSDKLSQVRGIGRYLQIIRENFSDDFIFISDLKGVKIKKNDSVFVNPFFNFLARPLTMRRIAQKQVAVIHDLIPLKYPEHYPAGVKGNFNIFLNSQALRNYDLIITDSIASKKDIVDILELPGEKVRVIYPCLPKVFLTKKISKRPADLPAKFCLYVGDATWNKNLVNLAKAIKIMNVTCIFVGKVFEKFKSKQDNFSHPWQREFKHFYELTHKDKRFIFSGFIEDEALIKLYQQASLNILPSRDEGFGFSWLEAASQGCPTVAADIDVLREIAGSTANFAFAEVAHDLADKIGEIYFNKGLRGRLGQKAKDRIGMFSPSKFKKLFFETVAE